MEVAEKALKAILLFAKLAQAKAEKENMIQLWNEPIPIQSFAEPASGWPFFIIILMVFSFGVMFGAVLAWFMIYPYFNRVTLVHSDIIPRPTFLMHALPIAKEGTISKNINICSATKEWAAFGAAFNERWRCRRAIFRCGRC